MFMILLATVLCVFCYLAAIVSGFSSFVFLFAGRENECYAACGVAWGFLVLAQCFVWLAKDLMKKEDE